MRLRDKMLLSAAAPAVVLLLFVIGVGIVALRANLFESESQEMKAQLANAARVIDRRTNEALAIARLLADTEESGMFGRRAESLALARRTLEALPEYAGVSIGYEPDADGQDRLYRRQAGAGHRSSDGTGRFLPHWFRDQNRDGKITLEPLVNMETSLYYDGLKRQFEHHPTETCIVTEPYVYRQKNLIVEHTCVIRHNGKFAGIAGVDRGLDLLSRFLRELKPLPGAELYLLSSRGRLIATSLPPKSDSVLRTVRVNDLRVNAEGRLDGDIYHLVDGKKEIDPAKVAGIEPADIDDSVQHMISRVVATREVGELINIVSPTNGLDNLASAARVPAGDWTLVMLVPVSEIDTTVRSTITWVAAVAMLGVAVVIWLLVELANGLSDRIRTAAELAREVADGDLTAQVGVEAGDESSRLKQAIRDMILSLRGLVGRVKRSSVGLISASNDIAAGVRQQEAAIKEFGAATNEIHAGARQIAGTSRELLNTMTDLNDVAESTADLAFKGRDGLTRMAGIMEQLSGSTASISTRLAAISDKAANINVVVTTIIKVADETNLLSLNAAIEAEKAGENGLGFSVVAREIRRLADQTAVATLEIESMVGELQSAVTSGVTQMEEFSAEVGRAAAKVQRVGGQLETIINRVRELTERFPDVRQGMESQAQGARQISDALTGLSEAVRETARTLKDYRHAGEILDKAVGEFRAELARFKVEEAKTPAPVAGDA